MSRTESAAPHVVAVITPHGFGHGAIVTAVLPDLMVLRPDCRLTLVTTLPEASLRARLPLPFAYVHYAGPADFGMRMLSATAVDAEASLRDYLAAALRWPEVVAEMSGLLRSLRPDMVLTSISFAATAAARAIGVPSLGIGPFTWVEIVESLCPPGAERQRVLATMVEAYAAADAILHTEPRVPSALPGVVPVGPVALPGDDRREALRQAAGLAPQTRLAFVSLGGIPEPLDLESWALPDGWAWLAPDAEPGSGVVSAHRCGLSVSQAIASCDAVVTKPGYGTFVEAACAGVPLLYRERPDWPETPYLHAWYAARLPVTCIDSATFSAGGVGRHLPSQMTEPKALLNGAQENQPPANGPIGNGQCAAAVAGILG